MTQAVEFVPAETYHGRKGQRNGERGPDNAFRYSVDYVLLDAEAARPPAPSLFSRNRGNVFSVRDRDHGGPPKQGRGAAWARDVLRARGLDLPGPLLLLTQPRSFGHVFNPVSFWLCHGADGALRAVIAEVSNTFGDRHSYLCHHADLRPITGAEKLAAHKIFHVSPFQPTTGDYTFRFDVTPGAVDIRIDLASPEGRLIATLRGPRAPLTAAAILRSVLRRPLGARRVLTLIHWQALKLKLKGARYRPRPEPPPHEVS